MKAAVVTNFDEAPHYADFTLPEATGPHEVLVTVVAAGLHPRVRSQAQGSHYTSTEELPLVPGIDGVGRLADGSLRYFILPDTTFGSMAEHTVIDLRRSVELPVGADPVQVAAAMNPAMSSWIALRRRIDFQPGQKVLIMGATGNSGRLAIQVAKQLGASHITAAGRNIQRLQGLGADIIVELGGEERVASQSLAQAGSDVDVVLDYLWGQPTHDALTAIIPNRLDDSQPLNWIQVGSVAGPESSIPSAALRAARLQIVGSGQGSVSTQDIVTELRELITAVTSDIFAVDARSVPLISVEEAWTNTATSTDRLVIVP